MRGIIKLFVAFAIMIFGGSVFLIMFFSGIIYTLLKHILKLDYSIVKQLDPIIRSVTLSLDGLACAGVGELLNDTLKIKGEIRYGKWFQTISAITGLIHKYEKDTWLRRFLDRSLGKNHCLEAISEQDKFYYENYKMK